MDIFLLLNWLLRFACIGGSARRQKKNAELPESRQWYKIDSYDGFAAFSIINMRVRLSYFCSTMEVYFILSATRTVCIYEEYNMCTHARTEFEKRSIKTCIILINGWPVFDVFRIYSHQCYAERSKLVSTIC